MCSEHRSDSAGPRSQRNGEVPGIFPSISVEDLQSGQQIKTQNSSVFYTMLKTKKKETKKDTKKVMKEKAEKKTMKRL